jgi:signal transduction histidine kinase
VAALAGLLILLGTLQYRWLGQVAETIAAQKRASLLRRGEALVGAVDREITRAYLWFRPDDSWTEERIGPALAERLSTWREAGRHGGLIKDVLVVQHGDVARVDMSTRGLVPLDAASAALEPFEIGPRGGPGPPLRETAAGPALLVRGEPPDPESRRPSASVLVVLDEGYLLAKLLPELAAKHLAAGDDDVAGVTIVAELRRKGRAAWRWPATGEVRNEIAPIPIFGARPDLAEPALLAGMAPPALSGSGFGRHGLRRAFGPPGSPRAFPPPGPPPPGGPGRGPEPMRPAWSLALGYAAGPVDALVTSLRRRNLAVSFGILAVLGGAIAVLALAFRRAQALAERHREFLASMSHELRTPLAVIASAAENLRDGAVDEPERVREYGSLIRDESTRLTGMVDDVLRMAASRGPDGEMDQALRLQPLDPRALVEAAIESLQAQLREQGGRIECAPADPVGPVRADAQALRQALENLLTNAIKYGGQPPVITVRLAEVETPEGRQLQIAVADRGMGIPADELPHIFEPFFRGREATGQQIHGTGLGLSLVWRVMKAHGGAVTVESAPGRGSCFTLRLPAGGGEARA